MKVNYLIGEDEIEDSAKEQILEVLLDSKVKELSIFPDVHAGYSLPIGSACLTEADYIRPDFVGYDIGCGVATASLGDALLDPEDLVLVKRLILQNIPIGFSKHEVRVSEEYLPMVLPEKVLWDWWSSAEHSFGTLGGGNHFIELGLSTHGDLYITVHTGSRGLGHKVASYFMDNPEQIELYRIYYNYASDYARRNREKIINIVGEILSVTPKIVTNTSHNVMRDFEGGILYQKGTMYLQKGDIGAIPFNMRDGVLLVEGLGNRDFLSCTSHGAGRTMSRNKARKSLDFDAFKESMGHITTNLTEATLDEAPEAYKSTKGIIDKQEGVVFKVVDRLDPILNIKG